jgi:hypothetical protein
MMEPNVPVFDRRDAEIYGWRFDPGLKVMLVTTQGSGSAGSLYFREPPGPPMRHDQPGDHDQRYR